MLKRCTLWLLAAALSFGFTAQATTVLPLSLDDMVDNATTVFQAKALENRTERDAETGLIVTYTKFEVTDVLKGKVGSVHEIKQVGGEIGDQGFRIMGVPTFKVGQEYVLFMTGRSAAGFSSPVGLAQGRFNVRREAGVAKVGNGRDFRDLAADIPAQRLPPRVKEKMAGAAPVRELELGELKQIVRDRLAVTRGTAGSVR